MQLRPAELGDLPQLKAVYQGIIRDMTQRDLTIWDEIYPCAFFEEDIEQNRLYLLPCAAPMQGRDGSSGKNPMPGRAIWSDWAFTPITQGAALAAPCWIRRPHWPAGGALNT